MSGVWREADAPKTLRIDRHGFTFVFHAHPNSGNRWVCQTLNPPLRTNNASYQADFEYAQRKVINELRDKKPFGVSWVRTR